MVYEVIAKGRVLKFDKPVSPALFVVVKFVRDVGPNTGCIRLGLVSYFWGLAD
jgi:hypothetical protein